MVTSIIAPTWKALGPNTVVVDRKGTMLLKFATSRDPSKPAEEQAEPAAKTLFSLTATDLGALLQNPLPEQLTFSRRAQGVETTAGTDRTLNVSRAAGGGVTFSITEASREGAVLNQLDVNMSAADFEVLRSVAMYSIPGLLGFTASLV